MVLIAGAAGLTALALGAALLRWGVYTLSRDAKRGWSHRLVCGVVLIMMGLAISFGDATVWMLL